MENNSHLTAILRKKLSRPCNYLKNQGLLKGKILDYGCGRGQDWETLYSEGYDIRGYDPYYQPVLPEEVFDTIFCIYVLNVIPDVDERKEVILSVRKKLKIDGKAYFAVRGKVNEGYTSRGTWQGNIFLDLWRIRGTSEYRIYTCGKHLQV